MIPPRGLASRHQFGGWGVTALVRTFENFIEPLDSWAALQRLRELVDQWVASETERDDLADRAAHVVGFVDFALKNLALNLVTANELTAIRDSINQTLAYIEQWNAQPDWGSIDAALDGLSAAVTALPHAHEGVDLGAATAGLRAEMEAQAARAQDLRRSINETKKQYNVQLREMVDTRLVALGEQVSALEARMQQREAELAQTMAEQAASFSNAELKRSQAAVDALTAQRAEFDQEQARIGERWDDLLGELREQHEQAREASKADFDALINKSDASSKHILNEMQSLLSQTKEVAGAVARTGHTAGFTEWEESEKSQADAYRDRAIKYGVAAAVTLAVLIATHLIFGDPDDFDATMFVATVSLPSALGVVATYLAREAHRHRRNQVFARRTALELATFEPFIATLRPDEKRRIVSLFTPVFFGQARLLNEGEKEDQPSLRLPTAQLLEAIVTSVVETPPKQPPAPS